MSNDPASPLAQALGRVPTGLYIVTTRQGDAPLGFVGSFVMQLGFEPPTMCVAIGKDRDHLAAIRANGRFGLSILDKQSQGLMSAFFKKDVDPFAELATSDAPGGSPTLDGALAWMECAVTGEYELGDHVVVMGTVEHGAQLRDGDPAVHLRKNGLGY